jgi:hypothetical protein
MRLNRLAACQEVYSCAVWEYETPDPYPNTLFLNTDVRITCICRLGEGW